MSASSQTQDTGAGRGLPWDPGPEAMALVAASVCQCAQDFLGNTGWGPRVNHLSAQAGLRDTGDSGSRNVKAELPYEGKRVGLAKENSSSAAKEP